MFRNNDLLAEFERLTKGFNLGAAFEAADCNTPNFDSPNFESTVFGNAMNDLSETFSGAFNAFTGSGGVDAVRSPERFELYIDLPGVDPATVDLTVEGRTLTVTADRSFTIPEGAELVTTARRHGTFSRSFRIGDDLNLDKVSARSEHGVLIVTIPVASSAKARKISISTDPSVIDAAAVDAGGTDEIDSPTND